MCPVFGIPFVPFIPSDVLRHWPASRRADGEEAVAIDVKKAPPIDGRYVSLGEYRVK